MTARLFLAAAAGAVIALAAVFGLAVWAAHDVAEYERAVS